MPIPESGLGQKTMQVAFLRRSIDRSLVSLKHIYALRVYHCATNFHWPFEETFVNQIPLNYISRTRARSNNTSGGSIKHRRRRICARNAPAHAVGPDNRIIIRAGNVSCQVFRAHNWPIALSIALPVQVRKRFQENFVGRYFASKWWTNRGEKIIVTGSNYVRV